MGKVVLILLDGLRPDAFEQSKHPFAKELKAMSASSLNVRTVMPSVTLPCHMSLFHSVTPQRHGIASNTYTPQVRPINGICEQLYAAGKKRSAFFYSWGELRDLARPNCVDFSYFYKYGHFPKGTDFQVADAAATYLRAEQPDFLFYYIAMTDVAGHGYGWMSPEYMRTVDESFGYVEHLYRNLPAGYTMIVTADHGGHDRTHGTDLPEDMTIPLFFVGEDFTPGSSLPEGTTILDIAPTIIQITGAEPDPEWEGKSLIAKA